MSYIVKNCPCLKSQISYKDKLWINGCSELGEVGSRMCCQDIADCVIKQVIEVCKKEAVVNYPKREKEFITVNGYQAILNIFDIEEINK